MPIYSYSKSIKDQTASQYASIKVAYSFDLGRKTQKVKKDVNKNIKQLFVKSEVEFYKTKDIGKGAGKRWIDCKCL